MTPVRRLDFSDVHLYAVTPEQFSEARLLEQAEKLLAGGIDALQLRCSTFSDRGLFSLGKKLKIACEKAGALFLINNRADLALAVQADGLHVGQQDLPVALARELVGHRRLLGVSTHSLDEALEAQKQGADYVSCGPVYATPTKPDYPAVGLNLIRLYKAALKIPFVAIGGVNENNIDQVWGAGATSVAVVRALFDSQNPIRTAQVFEEKIKRWR